MPSYLGRWTPWGPVARKAGIPIGRSRLIRDPSHTQRVQGLQKEVLGPNRIHVNSSSSHNYKQYIVADNRHNPLALITWVLLGWACVHGLSATRSASVVHAAARLFAALLYRSW